MYRCASLHSDMGIAISAEALPRSIFLYNSGEGVVREHSGFDLVYCFDDSSKNKFFCHSMSTTLCAKSAVSPVRSSWAARGVTHAISGAAWQGLRIWIPRASQRRCCYSFRSTVALMCVTCSHRHVADNPVMQRETVFTDINAG